MELIKVIDHVWWEEKRSFQLAQDSDIFWVMYLITKGQAAYRIGETSGIAEGPCILLCPPGVVFQREAITPLTFHFFRLDIATHFQSIGGILDVDSARLVMNEQVLRQYVYDFSVQSFYVRSHFVQDFFLFRNQTDSSSINELAFFKQQIHHPRVLRFLNYLETHYQEDISIGELSQRYNFNSAYLSRLFKKETGISPKSYLINLRLKSVQQLLVSTKLPIEEIAELTGFKYGYHLSKYFKQTFKISPSEFRKKHTV